MKGLLRKQDQPSGFGATDPSAFSPGQLLNGGQSRFNLHSDGSPERRDGAARSAYDVALGRAPSASPPMAPPLNGGANSGGTNTGGGGGGDYMAAMGGDWWRAWNQMQPGPGGGGGAPGGRDASGGSGAAVARTPSELLVVDLSPGTSPRSSGTTSSEARGAAPRLYLLCLASWTWLALCQPFVDRNGKGFITHAAAALMHHANACRGDMSSATLAQALS